MQDANSIHSILTAPKRTPWNKGKLIGAKPPLLARHVWSIRTKLQIERRARELAMFNLAIDSKLRGCDVVAMKVEDVAPSGYPLARATVRQRKTGSPVRFELTEQTRQAVDDYLKATGKVPGEFLFTSRRRDGLRCRQSPRSIVATFFLEGGPMNLIEKVQITTKAYRLRVCRIRPNFASDRQVVYPVSSRIGA